MIRSHCNAYARSKSKTKTQIGTLVSDNGISLNSDKDIAGYFNRYFSSVFTMEDNLNYSASTSMNADKADITCEDLQVYRPGYYRQGHFTT